MRALLVSVLLALAAMASAFVPLAATPATRRTLGRTGPLSVVITPDGSPSMQEYRKKVLQDLVERKNVRSVGGWVWGVLGALVM